MRTFGTLTTRLPSAIHRQLQTMDTTKGHALGHRHEQDRGAYALLGGGDNQVTQGLRRSKCLGVGDAEEAKPSF